MELYRIETVVMYIINGAVTRMIAIKIRRFIIKSRFIGSKLDKIAWIANVYHYESV